MLIFMLRRGDMERKRETVIQYRMNNPTMGSLKCTSAGLQRLQSHNNTPTSELWVLSQRVMKEIICCRLWFTADGETVKSTRCEFGMCWNVTVLLPSNTESAVELSIWTEKSLQTDRFLSGHTCVCRGNSQVKQHSSWSYGAHISMRVLLYVKSRANICTNIHRAHKIDYVLTMTITGCWYDTSPEM